VADKGIKMQRLLDLFDLADEGSDQFKAPNGRGGWITLFGGQIVAQALAAATRTIGEDKRVNSLHAYFMRPGAFDVPIDLTVERERDGGSFANRRVIAAQAGKAILSLTTSFHTGEAGPSRDIDSLPDVPGPESLDAVVDAASAYGRDAAEPSPLTYIDVRPIEGCQPFTEQPSAPPYGKMWFKFRDAVTTDAGMARIKIAYVSDLFLINTALQPHRGDIGRGAMIASIDHSVWFHDDPPTDDWMLFTQESPWASNGRTLCRGTIFARDGRRIATIAQEGLLRLGR
jgi:acyl-CoA thioesterase-2